MGFPTLTFTRSLTRVVKFAGRSAGSVTNAKSQAPRLQCESMATPESATLFLARQAERLRRSRKLKRIVFPEGDDPRVQVAAGRLQAERLVEPVLLRGESDSSKYAAI